MPVPLIPALLMAASALAAGKGTVSVAAASSRVKEAKRRYERRRRAYEKVQSAYLAAHAQAQAAFDQLGRRRLQALETLGMAVAFLRKARVKQRDLNQRYHITAQTLRRWSVASLEARDGLAAIAQGAGAGIATAAAGYGLVGVLGSASTGAAISSLSGAAAANATLAWLGGGALAAGGGGMALGAMVLNGIVAGPAILVGGFFLQRKAERIETDVCLEIAKLDEASAKMGGQMAVVDILMRRVAELTASTRRVHDELRRALHEGKPSCDQDAYRVARLGKALGDLLDVALVDSDGRIIT